jgi:hypothetical protein
MPTAGSRTEQVKVFLEGYASAFERLDRDAVADRYSYPAHVITYDGGVRLLAVPSREVWTAVIERILQMYGALGVRQAVMGDLRVVFFSPQIAQARLVWAFVVKATSRSTSSRRRTRWRYSTAS